MTHHQDAISLLTEDHRTVEQLFADYERGLQGPEAKRQVVDQITRELSIHAAVEEAYFYPEVRKALGEGSELVDESLHEHQKVKETLAALEDRDPADAAYDQKVAALIAAVRHHVEEEEGEMFPKLRTALSAEQLHDIGEKLADGKAKAPTRPHPAAPASGPGAKVAGPAAAWSIGSATSWATAPRTRAPSRVWVSETRPTPRADLVIEGTSDATWVTGRFPDSREQLPDGPFRWPWLMEPVRRVPLGGRPAWCWLPRLRAQTAPAGGIASDALAAHVTCQESAN